jgi:glucokinase
MVPHSEFSVLVYDVGGSHVTAAVCEFPGASISETRRIDLPSDPTPAVFLAILRDLCSQVLSEPAKLAGVSLSIPGPFDTVRGVSLMQHKLPHLYGFDLRRAIAETFSLSPDAIFFINDADAVIIGETHIGAARDASRAVVLGLGTGIGSAFSTDGVVAVCGKGIPGGGEIWNVPHRNGIVEDLLSSRAIRDRFQKLSGKALEVSEIARLAPGDAHASATFAAFGDDLATIIVEHLSEFAPDCIVLSGSISRSASLFLPALQRALGKIAQAALVGAGIAWNERLTAALPAEVSSC